MSHVYLIESYAGLWNGLLVLQWLGEMTSVYSNIENYFSYVAINLCILSFFVLFVRVKVRIIKKII